MCRKKKKQKEKWVDDGHTVVPMTGEEIPKSSRGFFQGRERRRNVKSRGKSDISRKETRAMIRAFFAVMLPRFLLILACFGIVFAILYFWLS